RVEHVVLDLDLAGLCALLGSAKLGALPTRFCIDGPRLDGQAHLGDSALCDAAAGLLAARTSATRLDFPPRRRTATAGALATSGGAFYFRRKKARPPYVGSYS